MHAIKSRQEAGQDFPTQGGTLLCLPGKQKGKKKKLPKVKLIQEMMIKINDHSK